MTDKERLKYDIRRKYKHVYLEDQLKDMFFIAVDVDQREPIRRVLGSDKASEFFYFYELASQDGTAVILYSSLLLVAEDEKRRVNGPTTVTSGFRSIPHNTDEGGHENSWHTLGRAMDTKDKLSPVKQSKVMLSIVGSMWKRLVYSTFLHTDNGFLHKK